RAIGKLGKLVDAELTPQNLPHECARGWRFCGDAGHEQPRSRQAGHSHFCHQPSDSQAGRKPEAPGTWYGPPTGMAARPKEVASVTDRAQLNVNGTPIELPVVVGTEGEKGIDIAQLRSKTGYVTLDPAFMNTASTTSA